MAMASGTQDIVTGDLEEMSFQYKAKQTGYETSKAALVFQSLGKRLPVMFGKLTSNSSERTLPGCPTFKSFNTQDGEASFVDHRKREVENTRTNLINRIGTQLPFGARDVASTVVHDACNFILALFTFMTDTMIIQNAA